MSQESDWPQIVTEPLRFSMAKSNKKPKPPRKPSKKEQEEREKQEKLKAEQDWKEWREYSQRSGDPTPAERAAIDAENARKQVIQDACEGWPWLGEVGRLPTVAPHVLDGFYEYRRPTHDQHSAPFMTCMEVVDIRDIILKYVFKDGHVNAASLGITCQKVLQSVNGYAKLWYWCCEQNQLYLNHCNEPVEILSPYARSQRRVPQLTIVSPIHDVKDACFYQKHLFGVFNMTKAMANMSEYFRNLHLHRVQFLTPQVLAITIPHLRNLKNLGVYNCPLINVGYTLKLLEIIRTDRMKGKVVELDFFPKFHWGPKNVGQIPPPRSYGTSWDNIGIDSQLATWGTVIAAHEQGLKQGVELLKRDGAFYKWLKMGPCLKVDEVIALLERGDATDEELAAWCAYPDYRGSVRKFRTLPNRPEGWKPYVSKYLCRECNRHVLGLFFHYVNIRESVINRQNAQVYAILTCLPCKLGELLDNENHHYHREKRAIARTWVGDHTHERFDDGLTPQDDDETPQLLLSQITSMEQNYAAGRMARSLDIRRRRDLKRNIDKENNETQMALPPMNTKYPSQHRTPEIPNKDQVEDKWNWVRRDRMSAHGHI